MEQEPKLRSIPPGGLPRGDAARGERGSSSRVPVALAVALAVALVLLVWSYFSLGSRIDALESQTQLLRGQIAERDDVISAQRTRLDEVRSRVQELLVLLDQPVPGMAAPVPAPAEATTPSAAEPPANP